MVRSGVKRVQRTDEGGAVQGEECCLGPVSSPWSEAICPRVDNVFLSLGSCLPAHPAQNQPFFHES